MGVQVVFGFGAQPLWRSRNVLAGVSTRRRSAGTSARPTCRSTSELRPVVRVQRDGRPRSNLGGSGASTRAVPAVECGSGWGEERKEEARWAQHAVTGLASVCLLTSGSPALAENAYVTGRPRVVDGDTLQVSDERIRLYGIDAPESKQMCKTAKGVDYACGAFSTKQLGDHIGNREVKCEIKNKDMYSRSVAVCTAGGEDLNKWMVSNGYAVAYRQYSKDYISVEEAAQSAHKGIWDGSFQMPADWRKAQKNGAGATAAPSVQAVSAEKPKSVPHPKGCDIKGNVNSKGEKIYHVPGGQYYDATIIDGPEEKWFCNEKEATQAGWRSSAR